MSAILLTFHTPQRYSRIRWLWSKICEHIVHNSMNFNRQDVELIASIWSDVFYTTFPTITSIFSNLLIICCEEGWIMLAAGNRLRFF